MSTIKERIAIFAEIASKLEYDGDELIIPGQLEIHDKKGWEASCEESLAGLADSIFNCDFQFRLKPQPEYVPFERIDEIFENAYIPEVIWVKYISSGTVLIMRSFAYNSQQVYDGDEWVSLMGVFKNFVFFNPLTKETKPFGKLKV